MSQGADTTEQIRRALIKGAEFQSDLIERDYAFAHRKRIPLAAFAHRPLDARSVCIGLVTLDKMHHQISEYRELGAPLLLMETDRGFDLWRVGSKDDRDERLQSNLSVDGTAKYFRDRPDTLRPMRLYEAKTVARIDRVPTQLNLFSNFVDPDLLPFVEGRSAEKLTATIVAGIQSLVAKFGPDEWIIKAVFRLLAGKILRDKGVPGFKSATLSHVEDMLGRIERHYGSKNPLQLSAWNISSLGIVMSEIQSLGDLCNLTTESLGDVYERALITPDIRKIHGTHKTPGYLVDYVVWQLARWIEEIPIDELRFFEPGCGHAPFLVSLMRLLRTFDRPVPELSQFVRERFTGVDNDPFALEIARLSLTVADEPTPDGWIGLVEADMYAEGFLEKAAANSTVMLTNPPYEKRKAEELLFRTLPQLPVGAVFGAIVPATVLFSDKKRAVELRSWMIKNCQLMEVDLFPDGLFTFGDHECALLAGRVLPSESSTKSLQTRLRRVRDNDAGRTAFLRNYQFGTTRHFSQSEFTSYDEQPLWIAEFQNEIWNYLKTFPKLASIAKIGKGLEFNGQSLPKHAKTVDDKPFVGSVEGFASSSGNWGIHARPSLMHFNLAEEVIRRPGTGIDRTRQVLMNYHPVSRGSWCLKPFVDDIGRPFQSNFLSIRPDDGLPLAYIWALLASPLANLFVFTNTLKRNIVPRILRRFPIPAGTAGDVSRIVRLADAFMAQANAGPRDLLNSTGYMSSGLLEMLFTLDAEVLRLYRLPAKAERLLLEQFRGEQRPGIPIPFTEYYPSDTPDVPLYVYLSKSYQRALSGGSPELRTQERERYETLCEKADSGSLTSREADKLYELQAEVDGRDYWMLFAGKRSTPVVDTPDPDEFGLRLRALSDRAATASIKQSKK